MQLAENIVAIRYASMKGHVCGMRGGEWRVRGGREGRGGEWSGEG